MTLSDKCTTHSITPPDPLTGRVDHSVSYISVLYTTHVLAYLSRIWWIMTHPIISSSIHTSASGFLHHIELSCAFVFTIKALFSDIYPIHLNVGVTLVTIYTQPVSVTEASSILLINPLSHLDLFSSCLLDPKLRSNGLLSILHTPQSTVGF